MRAYGSEPIGCFRARTGEADLIAEIGATLNGTVNPKGEAVTECFFEYGTTTAYDQIAQCEDPDASEIGTGSTPVAVHADIAGLDKGTVYHFRLLAKVGGETETGADVQFKTLGPPVISEEHVVSATDSEATLKALVNPEGFATTYRFEYGLTRSLRAEQRRDRDRLRPQRPCGRHGLEGLAPDTTYHWRIVATNSSGTSASEDHILRTYRTFAPDTDCPNQAFRIGPSALLPDCRAYEMVSPLDKNGGDIVSEKSGDKDPGGYMQASPDGDKITYTSIASFGDRPNSFRFNQYLAERRKGEPKEGWSSHGIHPPMEGARPALESNSASSANSWPSPRTSAAPG